MYEIDFDTLIRIIKQNYSGKVLLKVTNDEQHALDFSNGRFCLGTLQYYRTFKSNDDGRRDANESLTFPKIVGIGETADRTPVIITREDGLSGLALCFFCFDANKQDNEENLKRTLRELGEYVNIIDFNEADKLYCAVARSSFVRSISGGNKEFDKPFIGGNNDFVVYKDNPDYSGF